MEGVLVSAKQAGTIIRVTVVSDEQGRYTFPSDRLKSGRHTIEIRAAGYELEKPSVVDLVAGKEIDLDLRLQETQDLASQLTNAEWLISIPGTQQEKKALYDAGCTYCHSLTRVMNSKYDAKAWMPVLLRMRNRAPASRYLSNNLPYTVEQRAGDEELAQYLSSINLSAGPKRSYELKTLPRPTGKATRVIMTEYDLPRRDSLPHDAAVDSEGMIWYDDFALPYLGRLDPNTLEIREWKIPVPKPGSPEGSVDIQFDREGNPWIGRLLQAGTAKFDKETEQFTNYSVPERNNKRARTGMVAISPDGSVWVKDASNSIVHHLLDPETNQFVSYPTKIPGTYGMATDSKGDLWAASLGAGPIVKIDAKTGQETSFQPPTPKAGPRRIYMDAQDRFWFAEYYGHKVGRLDTKSKEFKEWPLPTPWAGPYDVVLDRNGDVWAGGMHTDFVFRLNPETGEVIEYLMPTLEVNVRRIDVDNSTNPPAVWIGENHQAKLIKIEALE